MTKETEDFVRAFEDLKREVNRRAHMGGSHVFEIERACDKDRSLRPSREFLIYVREIRNTLQHPRHRSDGHAVHISAGFLTEVQGLLQKLKNPPTAQSIGVARKDIKLATLTDSLGDLAQVMKDKGFSHLPILDERDAVIGVFNEAAVFDHLWSEEEVIVSRRMTVKDVFANCGLEAVRTETFRFVTPRTPIDDLSDLFASLASQFTRIGALFVTASGKKHEPLQRLITPWDVLISTNDARG